MIFLHSTTTLSLVQVHTATCVLFYNIVCRFITIPQAKDSIAEVKHYYGVSFLCNYQRNKSEKMNFLHFTHTLAFTVLEVAWFRSQKYTIKMVKFATFKSRVERKYQVHVSENDHMDYNFALVPHCTAFNFNNLGFLSSKHTSYINELIKKCPVSIREDKNKHC